VPPNVGSNVVGINDAHFTWQEDRDNESGNRRFRLKVNGMLRFESGTINLIVGATGSGKTSLLLALLGADPLPRFQQQLIDSMIGEMYYRPLTVDSWYSLPRHGGVAYAAQESWVLNETIRVC
jgi:energy-coupling factor transporter ATP-binding protein EcfA2